MVFMLHREFMALVDDEDFELDETMAQLTLESVLATFEKPEDEALTSQGSIPKRIC